MSIEKLIILIPAIIKFGTQILKGYKNAKKKHEERKFLLAVRSGDVDAVNRYINN